MKSTAAPANEKSRRDWRFLAMCHQQGGMLAGIFKGVMDE
jgi:hypothetical protein